MKTKEEHYRIQLENYSKKKPVILGPMSSFIYRDDPKHIGFIFARYKFVAKILAGKKDVLEIGCGDAFATPVVACEVEKIYCLDYESHFIENNKKRMKDFSNISFHLMDIIEEPFYKVCDAAFSLDVIEHIQPKLEEKFWQNTCRSLNTDGVCVIGTPNIESEKYASNGSKMSHINLKSYNDLQKALVKYFHNGFLFSVNDEVVHTGYYPMAHYLMAIGVGPR